MTTLKNHIRHVCWPRLGEAKAAAVQRKSRGGISISGVTRFVCHFKPWLPTIWVGAAWNKKTKTRQADLFHFQANQDQIQKGGSWWRKCKRAPLARGIHIARWKKKVGSSCPCMNSSIRAGTSAQIWVPWLVLLLETDALCSEMVAHRSAFFRSLCAVF